MNPNISLILFKENFSLNVTALGLIELSSLDTVMSRNLDCLPESW